ncbi:ATP-binding protein [Peterkaempfera bronchialis]|uniref:ATP-binding protein n=1 Tax=Peterkaempfera bronchialis TaxID=2126346 RepID=UPI0013B429BC|nr:ATP-binding protein [Peterkaempfera bronchialis]
MTVLKPSASTLRLTLPAVSASVPQLRREAIGALAAHGLSREHPIVDTALITLNELATNCVRHAAVASPTFDVRLTVEPGQLVLAVHDRHPYRPRALPVPHADDSGGWGLYLVCRLVEEAGGGVEVPSDRDGRGKTVIVRLPLC